MELKKSEPHIQRYLSNNFNIFNKIIYPIETFRLNENTLNSRLLSYLFEKENNINLDKKLIEKNSKKMSLKLYSDQLNRELKDNQKI